jgi:formate hydrogenlyase subunit 4
MMNNILLSIFQVLVILFLAPLVSWQIKKMKTISQNRVGPPLFQVYWDLIKLFRKGEVVSETASWIFRAMPIILFTSTFAASCLVPVFYSGALTGFLGDAILLIYLLALGKFFLTLAALDTGTTFGGMGSSREAALSTLAEPALLLALFVVGIHAKTLSLEGIASHIGGGSWLAFLPFTALAFCAVLIVTVFESGRIPFDNPATHLELTMVHEAMILEYSGPALALIEWSHQIKQLVLLTILANLFFPWGLAGTLGLPALLVSFGIYLVKIFGLAFVIGWIEIHSAKLRFFRLPDLLTTAFVLAALALLGQLMVVR